MWTINEDTGANTYMPVSQDSRASHPSALSRGWVPLDIHSKILLELRIRDVVFGSQADRSLGKIWSDDRSMAQRQFLIRFGSRVETFLHQTLFFIVLADLTFVPWVMAFGTLCDLEGHWQVAMLDFSLTVAFFILSVPVCLRTSVICLRRKVELTGLWEICGKRCLTIGFWMDVMSSAAAPCLYLGTTTYGWKGTTLRYLSLARFLKAWHLGRYQRVARESLLGAASMTTTILRGFGSNFYAAHLFGCIWFYAKMCSPVGQGSEWSYWNGWSFDSLALDQSQASSLSSAIEPGVENCVEHYVRSLKDGVYMLASYGGPDVLSWEEFIAVLIVGPGSMIISASFIDWFLDLTAKISLREELYDAKVSMVAAACHGLDVPSDVQQRIHGFNAYTHIHHKSAESRQMLQSGLSLNLLAEIKLHNLRNVLGNGSFFEGLPPRLLCFLVIAFEEVCFCPGDFVIRKNEVGDAMYVVQLGSVAVSQDKILHKPVKRLSPGDYFGEISLVFPFPRTAWVHADRYSVLMQLSKGRFDPIMEASPDDKATLLTRIAQACKSLIPDLEAVTEGQDRGKAHMAALALSELQNMMQTERPIAPTGLMSPKRPFLSGVKQGSARSPRTGSPRPRSPRSGSPRPGSPRKAGNLRQQASLLSGRTALAAQSPSMRRSTRHRTYDSDSEYGSMSMTQTMTMFHHSSFHPASSQRLQIHTRSGRASVRPCPAASLPVSVWQDPTAIGRAHPRSRALRLSPDCHADLEDRLEGLEDRLRRLELTIKSFLTTKAQLMPPGFETHVN